MPSKPVQSTALFTAPRLMTLFVSLGVALCSGTMYAYSAYSPQLGARLGMTHTQLNVIGSTVSLGVYVTGPVWGRFIDKTGPRPALLVIAVCLLSGYSGIRYIFNAGIADGDILSLLNFYLLVLFAFFIGSGCNGGILVALNATAKAFADRAQASTTGLVMAGVGASTFVLLTISRLFSDEPSSLLLVFALGTSIPMVIAFFLLDLVPPVSQGPVPNLERGADTDTERELLLPGVEIDDRVAEYGSTEPHHTSGSSSPSLAEQEDISGTKLFYNSHFWVLFVLLSMTTGVGLTYVYNVGSIAQALYIHDMPEYDPVEAAKWQAIQVSLISVLSCAGRFSIGLLSDLLTNTLALPRSSCLIIVSLLFLISQIVTASIEHVSNLWIASVGLGLAYGTVWGLYPSVILDRFGTARFSEIWGYIVVSPAFGAGILSLAFGRNFDAHTSPPPDHGAQRQCTLGRECYVSTFYLMGVVCLVALVVSARMTWQDWIRHKMRR